MPTYAANTDVSSERSRAEIERTLNRYGATGFAYGWVEGHALIGFIMNERHVRFLLPLPDPNSREFTHTPERNQARSRAATERQYEQAVKQRWRALSLVVKAKLEAVESGIVDFISEFGPFVVLPDGSRMIDHMSPAIETAYETGDMPALLPSSTLGGMKTLESGNG